MPFGRFRFMRKSGFYIVLMLSAVGIFLLLLPQLRQWTLRRGAEEVAITNPSADTAGNEPETLDLMIITIIGKDGIRAILEPSFLSADAASGQMKPNERVLGLSINGDHRAYPLSLMSQHEIVNDTVGGTPVAVTW